VGLISVFVAASMGMCGGSTPADARDESAKVLFVGNSLTYVGNLPGVFDALAAANGHASSSDMIAAGGATLTHWVEDGAVSRALATRSTRM
jgi:hypothetical protein